MCLAFPWCHYSFGREHLASALEALYSTLCNICPGSMSVPPMVRPTGLGPGPAQVNVVTRNRFLPKKLNGLVGDPV